MITTLSRSTATIIAFAALSTGTACTGDATPPAGLATGTAAPSTAAAAKEPRKVTDELIANAVDRTLLTDAALHNKQIDVKVDQGIVTLTGSVDSLMLKERAAKLCQTIRGVRSVVNTVVLNATSRTDDAILADVRSALHYDAATHALALKEEVKDGVVTLSGAVPSYREKQLAGYVAKGVKGVKGLRDSMALTTTSQRPDAEIAAELKRAMGVDVWLHPGFVGVNVKGGEVTLTGTVGSAAQYDRASSLAWTAGVTSVKAEGLKIEPWAKATDQRQETFGVRGDAQIKQAVQDAFVADPRVYSHNPRVEVDNGAATLTGVVTNLEAKRAAEQDAKNTWGVWRVQNLLKTRPASPIADDALAQDVTAALLRDAALDGYDLKVKARNGIIALSGVVDSYYETSEAEDVASRANGVLHVENALTVRYPTLVYYDLGYDPDWAYLPAYSDWDAYRALNFASWPYHGDAVVRDDIENKLYWSPWVNLDGISVKVANGVATLTGSADNSFESNIATQDAFEAGAQQVYNNVAIR